MKVLLTLTDVEPAVRLNKMLEAAEVETEVVSPLDDVRGVELPVTDFEGRGKVQVD